MNAVNERADKNSGLQKEKTDMENKNKELVSAADRYMEYENLVMEKERLKKEARAAGDDYFLIFGQLILKHYTAQVRIIRLKKEIALMQLAINKGEIPDHSRIQKQLKLIIANYAKEVRSMKSQYSALKNAETVSSEDLKKISKIYLKMAHLIHPDLHPELSEDPDARALWEELSFCYQNNDLPGIEEVQVHILKFLDSGSMKEQILQNIPDLDERIDRLKSEIEKIRTTRPYTYTDLIRDPVRVQRKIEEMEQEVFDLNMYSEVLRNEIKAMKETEKTDSDQLH